MTNYILSWSKFWREEFLYSTIYLCINIRSSYRSNARRFMKLTVVAVTAAAAAATVVPRPVLVTGRQRHQQRTRGRREAENWCHGCCWG